MDNNIKIFLKDADGVIQRVDDMKKRFHKFNILNDNLIEVMGNEKWDKAEHVEFTIEYNGDAVKSHEINVNDLANSLLGLSGVLENSNRVINGSNSDMFVKVKGSFKPASFEVDIVTLLTCSGVIAISNMINIVGFVGGRIKSLIWLYKQSRGAQIESITAADEDNVNVYFNGCTNPIFVNKHVVEIYDDKKVRAYLSGLVSPLKNENMSDITFIQDGVEQEKITRDELEFFEYEDDSDQNTIEGISEFLVTQFNLLGTFNGWRLRCINSVDSMYYEKDFAVKILDNSFLKSVKNKFIIISNEKPTIIKAKYRLTIQKTERTVTSWEILKVLGYTHEIHKYQKINSQLDRF